MKSNIFLRFITSCIYLLIFAECNAADLSTKEALYFAETKGKELLLTFQEPDLAARYAKLDNMVKQYVDIDYVSKFVIGKYWRQMTAKQKQDYQNLFLRYGLAFYKTLPLDYVKNVNYQIKGAEYDGKFVTVSAVVSVNLGGESNQGVMLVFRLHKVNNIIKAVDVKVAESSLLLSYRSKFYEMIAGNDGEIDWFLEDLSDLTSTLENSLEQNVVTQQKSLEFDDKTI